MPVPAQVAELIERFSRNTDTYTSAVYNETNLRREFLDPLFEALGWDLTNKQGYADAYKDVIHEDSIKVTGPGGGTKAPDYCFRIGGTRKFFLEAKKPSVDIKGDPSPAYQLRRYAWSAKLPISVLSDFQEFAIYDTRIKPAATDKPSTARIFYCRYTDLPAKWDEIAAILSKDAILKGAFDKYAHSTKSKRGTAEVDDAFLQEIETWRNDLAANIALRNPSISERDLNFAVTKTIDRIVFLRICEDRGIEIYAQLQTIAKTNDIYGELLKLFRRADEKYNSGLFHFTKEKDRPEEPDTLTPSLDIDDKTLRPILSSLYYPECPYEFSVLPADILGHVYEQFLGKVIRLTPGHRAKVEEKPEVRKAGGVYYTPTYIVDYIVQNTLGKLLAETSETRPAGSVTPKDAAKLKILDPACGSGSFLLGAYQFLLDWHLRYYASHNPEQLLKQKNPPIYQTAASTSHVVHGSPGVPARPTGSIVYRLTTSEKKRILLNNIFGVDIDQNAVETTKLSLLLKVLEGESKESLANQMKLFRERALPDLANNIKCGNSLIESDFYHNGQLSLIDDEETKYKINAFDWRDEFPFLKLRSFDAVIGNPPYFNMDDTWGNNDPKQRYIKRKYSHIYNDKTDILFYFLSRAVEFSQGEVGFIVSRAFFEAYKADRLRAWLAKNATVQEIVDFRNYYVFPNVGITTALVFLSKKPAKTDAVIRQLISEAPAESELTSISSPSFQTIQVNASTLSAKPWTFATSDNQRLLDKIDRGQLPLSRFLDIGQGMQTGCNDVFGSKSATEITRMGLKQGQYFARARNSDIHRYFIEDSGEFLMYLEDFPSLEALPRSTRAYLEKNAAALKKRAAFKRGNCEWWRYTWPLHKENVRKRKLLCPYLAQENRFALDANSKFLGLTDTTVLYESGQPEDMRYLLALLNSRLLTYRFRYIGKLKGGGILEYFWNSVSKIPIHAIDKQNATEKGKHDRLVQLADTMLALHQQLAKARTGREQIQRQIDATDHQIDALVYQLYNLTPDEIKLVESVTA